MNDPKPAIVLGLFYLMTLLPETHQTMNEPPPIMPPIQEIAGDPEQPPPVESEPEPKEVTMYSADWCVFCSQGKAAFKGIEGIRLIEVTENYPSWVESLPTFDWIDANGVRRSLSGWSESYVNRILNSLGLPPRDAKSEEVVRYEPISTENYQTIVPDQLDPNPVYQPKKRGLLFRLFSRRKQ